MSIFFKPEDALHFSDAIKSAILRDSKQADALTSASGKFTIENAKKALEYIRDRAKVGNFPWYKGMRPHNNIPEIVNFKVPKGDYSIGVEIEHRMANQKAREEAIDFIFDMDYVCLDSDGGGALLEATFPPILLSEIDEKWNACRWLDFLKKNKSVATSDPTDYVGIHVNIGSSTYKGMSHDNFNTKRVVIATMFTAKEAIRYFGRNAVGMHPQSNGVTNWVEMRMFHTTDDSKTLLWYVVAARILMDWVEDKISNKDLKAIMQAEYNNYWSIK